MKPLLLSLTLLLPTIAQADSYILGAGRWTCQTLLTANEASDMPKLYQAAGWLMGYWSAETNYRDDNFVNIVEQVGGRAILDQTVAECEKLPKETLLYDLANSMIENTG